MNMLKGTSNLQPAEDALRFLIQTLKGALLFQKHEKA